MKLNILFLSYAFSPSIGGIESSSELLVNAFREAGHHVRVMTMTVGDREPQTPDDEILRNPSLPAMLRSYAWADVIFENNPCLNLAWPKLFFGKPSVVVIHTWISRIDGRISLLDRLKTRWLGTASRVVAVSRAVQQRSWPNATVIGNSYNEKLFRAGAAERPNDFVFVGRLVSDKGTELAIRAFADLVFVHPVAELNTATLTIIGEGEERPNLEKLIAELPDPGRVRLVGSLRGQALADELSRHRFQFIPSLWEEPFGIVALEGIACGLIPIASNGGGLPDAVGEAGVTFRRGDLDSLVRVTTQLVQSPDQQRHCRQAAPAHLQKHSPAVITGQFLTITESLATRNRAASD